MTKINYIQFLLKKGKIRMYTLKELLDNDYNPTKYIIKDFMLPGAYILAGAPKCGKSILSVQIATAVANGSDFFNRPTNKGVVIYYAFEDRKESFIKKCSNSMDLSSSVENIIFNNERKSMDAIFKDVEALKKQNNDLRLVIVDTLQLSKNLGDDRLSYGHDYDIIKRANDFAFDNQLCLLFVHHTRKEKADDPFDAISGTRGLTGACEGMFVLERKDKFNQVGKLYIQGRSQRDNVITLFFNSSKTIWEYRDEVATDDGFKLDPILEKVVNLVGDNEWRGSATELASLINYEKGAISLSRYLAANAETMYYNANIKFQRVRVDSTQRLIILTKIQE